MRFRRNRYFQLATTKLFNHASAHSRDVVSNSFILNMKLFEDIERTFLGPAEHNENSFDYYQRSARKDISIIRETLNEWFNSYPQSEKKELKNSFKKHFDDCFYELFLFQLFTKLEFEIEIHPELKNSSKRPDFLIKRDDLKIYIEAKTFKNKSKKEEAIERKINQFYDNLSKLELKGFLLKLDTVTLKNNKQPSTRGLIKNIETTFTNLDHDLVTNRISKEGLEGIPEFVFENEDLLLIIKPIPILDKGNSKSRPIGMYPFQSFWGTGGDSLKEAISMKAKRYGKLEHPFLVCINTLDIKTSNTDDIENAIWGSLAVSWSEDPNNRNEKLIRKMDGLFMDKTKPRLTNLSGVLVTKVYPHNVPSANYWLFEHPFSDNKLNFDLLGMKKSNVKNDAINTIVGDNLNEILNIAPNWLNPDLENNQESTS